MPKSSIANERYAILDEGLMERIAGADEDEQSSWLILSKHHDFPGHWRVDCLEPAFLFDFEDLIGPYRAVSVPGLPKFLDACEARAYRVAFEEPPESLLSGQAHLSDPPPFSLNSSRDGTVCGFYPWQLQGFNFLKDQPGGKAIWSTGTGKTALAAALIRYHLEQGNANLVFYTAKVHARINTIRKLKQLADIDAELLDSYKLEKREDLYADLYERLHSGEKLVLVTNYEKFREDEEAIKLLVEDQDLLCIWDEMPTKLSNRETLLYESVVRTIWKTKRDQPGDLPNPLKSAKRVRSYRGYMMTATPIENDPEGDYNCTRLVRPEVFGSVGEFRSEYVASYNFFNKNRPERFHKLDKMALRQAHITHVVNKKDPDIAKFFPKVVSELIEVDWHPSHRKVYDKLTGKAMDALEGLEEANVLAVMSVMQMMCDAPSMINKSAVNRADYELQLAEWMESDSGVEPDRRGSGVALELLASVGRLSDDKHGKKAALKDIILGKHPDDHGLCYTAFGPMLLPILSEWLTEWGVSHVVYAGTHAARQRAYDTFRKGNHQIFLSSDAGSDSIDMEFARFGIDYDLPWKYVTRVQRWNRANRAGADHESQFFYSLVMAGSMERRKLEIIAKKQGYHESVYEGKLNDAAVATRMTREDLIYMITGGQL